MNNNQQLIKGSIIALIIAGAIGALTVFAGDSLGRGFSDVTGKLFTISFSLIFFGITAAICMVTGEKSAYKGLGTAGIIVSGAGFLLMTILILTDFGDSGGETLLKLAFSLFIASIALAHICLLHHFNLQNKYAHTARITATACISIFSLIIIITIFGGQRGIIEMMSRGGSQSMMKLAMASLVIDLACTALVPLCNRLKVEEPVKLTFTEEQPQKLQEEQKTES